MGAEREGRSGLGGDGSSTGGTRGRRELKERIRSLLERRSPPPAVEELRGPPASQVIHTLFSLLSTNKASLRSRAAAAFGLVVSDLALVDIEAARNVMRRLMWSVNDESGGIGWGTPEAMAEILARHEGLAREYAPILISYLREDGNFLGHGPLEKGLLRAINRVAETRSDILRSHDASRYLRNFLQSQDPTVRQLAARALRRLDGEALRNPENLLEER